MRASAARTASVGVLANELMRAVAQYAAARVGIATAVDHDPQSGSGSAYVKYTQLMCEHAQDSIAAIVGELAYRASKGGRA